MRRVGSGCWARPPPRPTAPFPDPELRIGAICCSICSWTQGRALGGCSTAEQERGPHPTMRQGQRISKAVGDRTGQEHSRRWGQDCAPRRSPGGTPSSRQLKCHAGGSPVGSPQVGKHLPRPRARPPQLERARAHSRPQGMYGLPAVTMKGQSL